MAERGPLRMLRVAALAAALCLASAAPAHAELEFLTQWGSAAPGEVVLPVDVERDAAGNTYVLDPFARTVTKYDSANGFVLRWGALGSGPGEFEIPTAIGVNEASGEVYVSDVGGRFPDRRARIERFDSNGTYLGEFGGFGTGEGQLGFASGISVHPISQDVFVAEQQRIQRFSAGGQFERMWGKDVQAGNANTGAEVCTSGCKAGATGTLGGELSSPSGVAVNQFGVFVTEDGNKRIQRFTADGTFLAAGGRDVVQGGGTGHEVCNMAANCKTGTSGTANGELDEPQGIDVDTDAVLPHNVYFVDGGNSRVQNWDHTLNPIAPPFGSPGAGDGQFRVPDGIAESQGSVVVADLGLSRLQRFSGAGAFQARFGEPGQSTLVLPEAIGTGPGGVYVTDFRDRVLRFDAGGGFIGAWGSSGTSPGQFLRPAGVAGDSTGNMYVADQGNSRIQRFDAAGAALGTWGTSGPGPGEFNQPVDVAAGPGGEVYTLESGNNNRIQKFNQIGAFMGTWGAPGTALGQFSGDGVATDPQGNVYVADTVNDRIQKFDPNGNLLTAWGSPGTGNGEFDAPADVTVDGLGNVYVVERDNHRVQRFTSNGTFLNRLGANGGDGSFGDGPGEFYSPTAIAVDATRDIYVLDFLNGRVQKFARANAAPAPDLTLGARKRQSPARLRVKVGCGGAPCNVHFSGRATVRPGAGGKSALASRLTRKLKPKTIELDAGVVQTTRIKLRKQKRSVRMLKSALADGGKGKAVIRARATNAAGADAARVRIKLKR